MKKRLTFTLLTALLSGMSLSSLSSHALAAEEARVIDHIVAVVDDQIILRSELRAKFFQKAQELQAQNVPIESPDALRKQVLDNMILEAVQLNRANQLGLRIDDGDVNARLEQIAAQNNLSMLEFRNRINLEQENGFDKLRNDIKEQMLIQKLREVEVISKATVTQNEIDNYLKRQQLATQKVERKLQHILLALPESTSPAQRKQLLSNIESLRKRVIAGEDFGQLAVRFSNGANALNGGELGWLSDDNTPTFFNTALQTMNIGDVSPVIASPSGFHLIKLLDQRTDANDNVTQYHMHRFLVLDSQPDPMNPPRQLVNITRSMSSLSQFNALNQTFKDIPEQVNARTDLGWQTLNDLPPPIRQAIETMPTNSALPPIATPEGWTILFLEEKRQSSKSEENKTQAAIQAIRLRKANEMFDIWLRRLKDEANVRINL